MTKLKSLIIDDEPLAHKVILEYANDVPFLEITGQCHLATEALSVLQNKEIDLIFLDIQMPRLTGLNFLRTLNKQPLVIITSAFDEYALESFELDVCDYLLKPFRFERFLKAVNKAYGLFQLKQKNTPSPQPAPIDKKAENHQLFIKSDKRLIQIDLMDIYYLESYGNYVKVWMSNEFHLTFRTLSSFEAQLPEEHFFRIHKSYIINKKYINYIEGSQVLLKNDIKLSIGKNNLSAFKKFIAQ
ncbi:MAG: LytTR family DNA-binding domain-containing protein [Bacteroidota bacterium]